MNKLTPPPGTPSLESFLTGPRLNIWLEDKQMKVYVRRGMHMLDQISMCLDIANVTVFEEYRGKGIFTEWLTYAESMAGVAPLTPILARRLRAVYVENILNPRFKDFLSHRGYLPQPQNPESLYKIISESENYGKP